jgi:serine/threonine-protein kinase PknG
VAERRFLAEVQHPSIVGVYNFVQHPDPRSGALTGYIVMEYVGGKSLRQILLDRRAATGDSLPVPDALAYAIEVLPALGYLHSRGLVYCDFKPDNVIQVEEQIKLIDMGAVRRIDDEDSPVFGTVGYQAPEIATLGPSAASDLYTVGRSLAVLTFQFPGWRTEFEHSLPDPATIPVLATHNSFLRALRRATHADPDSRFESAAEMAQQLTGVLREVLAVADGKPRPGFSALFSAEVRTIGTPDIEPGDEAAPLAAPSAGEIAAGLPVPAVDSADPAAGFLATLSTLDQAQRIAALTAAVQGGQGTPPAVAESMETQLALARAAIVSADTARAAAVLAAAAGRDPGDWRITWYTGLLRLVSGDAQQARAAFDAVLDVLPGELAPKLALGLAAEAAGDHATAGQYLDVVWTVDRSYVSAAFGLARMKVAAGDVVGAVTALTAVPESSSQYLAAQVAAIRIRLTPPSGHHWVSGTQLHEAARQLGRLRLSPAQQQHVTAELLLAALARVVRGQPLDSGPLLGVEPSERAVRLGLENSYRQLARLSPDRARRVTLVDKANEVRPRTWS